MWNKIGNKVIRRVTDADNTGGRLCGFWLPGIVCVLIACLSACGSGSSGGSAGSSYDSISGTGAGGGIPPMAQSQPANSEGGVEAGNANAEDPEA